MANSSWRYIGKRIRRKEDLRVLLGETRYVDDINDKRPLLLGILRSQYAKAGFKVDFSSIREDPRVLLCISGEDIDRDTREIPLISAPSGCKKLPWKALAIGKTNFVGEPLAAIVIEGDAYQLYDILEQIAISYEPEEPLTDAIKAMNANQTIHQKLESNVVYSTELKRGDVESAFADADAIISETFSITRQYGAAMEPRGAIADYERSSSQLTVYSSTQWPHFVRTLLAETLNHPESKIRVIAPDVGGGFGNKQDLYREEVLVSYAAKKLGRRVKWTATRSEDFTSTVHSGDQIHYAEIAVSKEGQILALRDHIIADVGSYGPMSLGPPYLTLLNMTGPYMIENVAIRLDCVATNKTPVGAYRGFGQQQAAFVLERLVDEAAIRLGLDSITIRKINVAKSFPYRTATGRVIDTGDYVSMLKEAENILKSLSQSRSERPDEILSVGIAFGFESAGIGPSFIQAASGARHKGYESMTVRILPDGMVEVLTALSPHGQGLETTLSQVCADLLGISPEEVEVRHGDTLATPYGYGTWGSRSAVVGAGALYRCVEQLKAQMLLVASKFYDVPIHSLVFEEGMVKHKDDPSRSITLKQLAKIAYEAVAIPAPLEATSVYEPEGLTVSGGLHLVLVSIDKETSAVRILNYTDIEDSGVMINPDIVEGQLHGGITQGIASFLFEGLQYSEEGQLLTNSFMEYLIPTAKEVPNFDIKHLDSPTNLNPLGIKGIGESGIVGPSAAIANAIRRATLHQNPNLKFNSTPFLPFILRSE
ncbi:MAG: xanthine dehydrogenase family protein molybdopterin-binding subunit [Conexivisphaerales archaeon]